MSTDTYWYLCKICCTNSIINYISNRKIFTPLIFDINTKIFNKFTNDLYNAQNDSIKLFDFFYGQNTSLESSIEHIVPRSFYANVKKMITEEEFDIASSLYYTDQHNISRGSVRINSIRSNYPFKNIDVDSFEKFGSIKYMDEQLEYINKQKFKKRCDLTDEECTEHIYSQINKDIVKGGYIENKDEILIGKNKLQLPDESKGIAARSYLYILFTYGIDLFKNYTNKMYKTQDPKISDYYNTEIVQQMIEWNIKYPPTKDEIEFTKIKTLHQGNNNPFIDDYCDLDLTKMIIFSNKTKHEEHAHIKIINNEAIHSEIKYLNLIPDIKISKLLNLFNYNHDDLLLHGSYINRINFYELSYLNNHYRIQFKYFTSYLKNRELELTCTKKKLDTKHNKKNTDLVVSSDDSSCASDDSSCVSDKSNLCTTISNYNYDLEKIKLQNLLECLDVSHQYEISDNISDIIIQLDKITDKFNVFKILKNKKNKKSGGHFNKWFHFCY
jgi:endonuclease I